MSKSFKTSLIFFISVIGLSLFRIIFSFINLSDNIGGWLFSLVFQTVFLGLIPVSLYMLFNKVSPKELKLDLRLTAKINPVSYLLVILIGIFAVFLNVLVSSFWYTIMNLLGYTYADGVGTIFSSWEVLLLELIMSAVLPAVFEEITYRGVLLSALDGRRISDNAKIIIVGVFFGFVHQNAPQLVPTMVGGLIFAFLAVKSHSIIPCMICHFMNNAFITLVNFSEQNNGFLHSAYTVVMGYVASNFISLFISAGIAVLILYWLLRSFAKMNFAGREVFESVKTVTETEVPSVTRVSDDSTSDVFDIYSSARLSPAKDTVVENKTQKSNYRSYLADYGFLLCAFICAALTTVFTFIWGVLR